MEFLWTKPFMEIKPKVVRIPERNLNVFIVIFFFEKPFTATRLYFDIISNT